MVIVLSTSFLLLALVSVAIYFWQRTPPNDNPNRTLPPPPDFRGLFDAPDIDAEEELLKTAAAENDFAEKRRALLFRAADGDKAALTDAQENGDRTLYDEVLNALIHRIENEKQLLALVSFIARSDSLAVNHNLARTFLESWKRAPDRLTTAEMLHLSARVGDAALYQHAIEMVLQYWREQKLQDITPEELAQLVQSEFWILPSDVRNSGAGFLLKQKLAGVRHQLAPKISDKVTGDK
jgi:hypothetical protein